MAAIIVTALLALWLAFAATGLAGTLIFAHQARKFGRLRFPLPSPPPAVAVIVPMKGAGAHAEQCFGSVLTQDYPAYRVIVAVEVEGDPAARLARDAAARAPQPVAIVAAGRAERRGQKVHNLAVALQDLSPGDEIVCFADSDALWSRDTLSTLVRELSAWDRPVLLSGYRWMFPAAPKAGAVLTAAASLSVAAIAKSPRWDLAWGGTMAAKRSTLERVGLVRLWERSLSDDVPLSRALRAGGLDVKLMPNLFVPSPCDFSLGAALDFAHRQYAMLRLYSPRHWLFSLAVYAVFFAGLGASLAPLLAPLPDYAHWLAGAAWTLTIARGLLHAAIAVRALPRTISLRLFPAFALDTLLPLLPALLHAYGLLASIRVRKLRWAGIAYALAGSKVEHVER
jgi:cellulose synthase/poly-beta-1,6-N-acetylglucosamine synthase-like glycosyltransferase